MQEIEQQIITYIQSDDARALTHLSRFKEEELTVEKMQSFKQVAEDNQRIVGYLNMLIAEKEQGATYYGSFKLRETDSRDVIARKKLWASHVTCKVLFEVLAATSEATEVEELVKQTQSTMGEIFRGVLERNDVKTLPNRLFLALQGQGKLTPNMKIHLILGEYVDVKDEAFLSSLLAHAEDDVFAAVLVRKDLKISLLRDHIFHWNGKEEAAKAYAILTWSRRNELHVSELRNLFLTYGNSLLSDQEHFPLDPKEVYRELFVSLEDEMLFSCYLQSKSQGNKELQNFFHSYGAEKLQKAVVSSVAETVQSLGFCTIPRTKVDDYDQRLSSHQRQLESLRTELATIQMVALQRQPSPGGNGTSSAQQARSFI